MIEQFCRRTALAFGVAFATATLLFIPIAKSEAADVVVPDGETYVWKHKNLRPLNKLTLGKGSILKVDSSVGHMQLVVAELVLGDGAYIDGRGVRGKDGGKPPKKPGRQKGAGQTGEHGKDGKDGTSGKQITINAGTISYTNFVIDTRGGNGGDGGKGQGGGKGSNADCSGREGAAGGNGGRGGSGGDGGSAGRVEVTFREIVGTASAEELEATWRSEGGRGGRGAQGGRGGSGGNHGHKCFPKQKGGNGGSNGKYGKDGSAGRDVEQSSYLWFRHAN